MNFSKSRNRLGILLLAVLSYLGLTTSCLEDTSCGQTTESEMLFQFIQAVISDPDTNFWYEKIDSTLYFDSTLVYVYDSTQLVIVDNDTTYALVDSFIQLGTDSLYTYELLEHIDTILPPDTTYLDANDDIKAVENFDTVYPRITDDLAMLPLQLEDTVTEYAFIWADSLTEYVRFFHSLPEIHYLDFNCGFVPVYNLKPLIQVSGAFIDSFQIANPEVSEDVSTTNIYIYF